MVIFFIVLFTMLYLANRNVKMSTNSNTCVKGHKWVYRNADTEEEYMVCDNCKYLPGMEHKEERN